MINLKLQATVYHTHTTKKSLIEHHHVQKLAEDIQDFPNIQMVQISTFVVNELGEVSNQHNLGIFSKEQALEPDFDNRLSTLVFEHHYQDKHGALK